MKIYLDGDVTKIIETDRQITLIVFDPDEIQRFSSMFKVGWPKMIVDYPDKLNSAVVDAFIESITKVRRSLEVIRTHGGSKN